MGITTSLLKPPGAGAQPRTIKTLEGRNFKGAGRRRTWMPSEKDVLKALAGVKDPELGRDVVSLHMIEGVKVEGGKVTFTLNLTTPACPLRTRLEESVKSAVGGVPGVREVVMVTGSNVSATREYESAEMLKGVKNVIAVASGKGGVGKSTIAVNLAVALAASGAKVGILDADVYGPNIPLMMGVKAAPEVRDGKVVPLSAHGVKVASLGFFYNEETPVIWRGPLVAGAVRQLLTQVDWGELDYLICDMPPGCLPAGTSVLMADNSPKPIEELEIGDFVLSYDGAGLVPRRVLGMIPQGEQEVYRLKTADREVIASANHPFLKHGRPDSWVRLDQLKARDSIIVPNCIEGGESLQLPRVEYDPRHIRLPRKTTVDFMRVVGRFVGVGFLTRREGRPVGLGVREPHGSNSRETFEELCEKVFGCREFDDAGGRELRVPSAPLAELFAALGLERSVPRWIFTLPRNQRLAFIRGYSEGSSSVHHREAKALPEGRGSYTTVIVDQDTAMVESPSLDVVNRLHELCLISGVSSTLVGEQKLAEGKRASHRLKLSLKHDTRRFKASAVESIEPIGPMGTFDLQVDQYENFVANSTLVHNTGDASLTLAQTVPLGGVVIVTTPQDAALNIAAKALAMFKRLNVPILGVVENMSYFVCPHCGEKTPIFSTGGGKKIAAERDVDFLGEVPFGIAIREQSDRGNPIVAAIPNAPESMVYRDLAFRVAGMVSIVAFAQAGK